MLSQYSAGMTEGNHDITKIAVGKHRLYFTLPDSGRRIKLRLRSEGRVEHRGGFIHTFRLEEKTPFEGNTQFGG
jgi:hypothetical protein